MKARSSQAYAANSASKADFDSRDDAREVRLDAALEAVRQSVKSG